MYRLIFHFASSSVLDSRLVFNFDNQFDLERTYQAFKATSSQGDFIINFLDVSYTICKQNVTYVEKPEKRFEVE